MGRTEMKKIGMHVYGDYDSPIIPCLIYFPAKIAAFSRECLKRGLAVVVVGFPATSVILSRVRFCISAGHSRAALDSNDSDMEVGDCEVRINLSKTTSLSKLAS